jgi:hypothetical protein
MADIASLQQQLAILNQQYTAINNKTYSDPSDTVARKNQQTQSSSLLQKINDINSQIQQAQAQQANQSAMSDQDKADNESQQKLYDSLKGNFYGFDKDGNPVVKQDGDIKSLDKTQFKYATNLFKTSNPQAQNGSYEDNFNKDQFSDLESKGNKFQGFDASGNLVYKNEIGDLENFGNSGGFADFAKKQMADKKFDINDTGTTNTTKNEDTVINPNLEGRALASGSKLSGQNKFSNQFANNFGQTNSGEAENNSGSFAKFQQSQMEKNVQKQNDAVQKAQIKKAAQNQKPSAKPDVPKMVAGFAEQQATKAANNAAQPVFQQANQQATAAYKPVAAQANAVANPYIQQAQDTKSQAGNAIQQATGFNPFTSVQNQAVNKVADTLGIDGGLLNQGISAINNPQQAIQNLAKQQVSNSLSGLISDYTGADSGMTSGLVNGLASGNVGQAASSLAQNQAQNFAADQVTNLIGDQAASAIPGGVSGAINVLKSLSGGGNSEQKASAAAKAAALAATQAALAGATGGLSYIVNPQTLQAGANGLTSIKNSNTLNRMGVAGDAVKGASGLVSGNLNAVADLGNIGLNSVGNTASNVVRSFKGAGQGLQNITRGNIGTGLGQLSKSVGQGLIDTFVKNPVDLAGNVIHSLGSTAGKVGNAVVNALKWVCFDPETEIFMADGSLKKVKDLKVGDEMLHGGKVNGVGESVADKMVYYGDVLVSSTHAVFEDGKWIRVGDSKQAKSTDLKSHVVVPIANEKHIVITKDHQVWADISEIDDTQDYTEDERLEKLNSQKNKNRLLKVYMNAHKKV